MVLTSRDAKHAVTNLNSSKACLTLVMCVTAAGEVLPMTVVCKGKEFHDSWIPPPSDEDGGLEVMFGFSKTGWMNYRLMKSW